MNRSRDSDRERWGNQPSQDIRQPDRYSGQSCFKYQDPADQEITFTDEEIEKYQAVNPNTLSFEELVSRLHPTFITDYLERILAFLQSRRDDLWFANLAPFKEQFLVKLATDTNNFNTQLFSAANASIARKILDILEANRNVFKLEHSYKAGMISKRVLTYEKVYLNAKQEAQDDHLFKMPQQALIKQELDSIDKKLSEIAQNSDYTTNSASDTRAVTKKQRNFKSLLDSLSVPFLMSTMQSVLDFLQDDTRDTLTFSEVSSEETRFIQTVHKFPLDSSLCCFLSDESYRLASDIRRVYEDTGTSLKINEGYAKRRGRMKTVTITKKLDFNGDRDRKAQNSRSREEPRDLFLKALSVSTDSEDSTDIPSKHDSSRSAAADNERSSDRNDRRRSDRNDRRRSDRYKKSPSGIEWQKARTSQEATSKVSESFTSNPAAAAAAAAAGGSKQRRELIHGLSQPLESDKAKRMMQMMGWKGGALGVRGEGITEPIMPALNIKAGAGLGHSASPGRRREHRREPRLVAARTPPQYRLLLLENILDLLRSKEESGREIAVDEPLSRKETKFAKTSISAFNNRSKVGLESDRERDYVCRILANLNCMPGVCLDVELSTDYRLMTIVKTKKSRLNSGRRRKRHSSDPSDCQSPPIDIRPTDSAVKATDIDKIIDKLGNTYKDLPKKSLVALAYKIVFFKKILDLVQSDNDFKVIDFEERLSNKQCKFIENTLTNINRKEKADYSCKVENDIYNEIKKSIDCHLKVSFGNSYKRLILEKHHYKRRFINTSSDRKDREKQRTDEREKGSKDRSRKKEDRKENKYENEDRKENEYENEDRKENEYENEDRKENEYENEVSKSDHGNDSYSEASTPSLRNYDAFDIELDDSSNDCYIDDDKPASDVSCQNYALDSNSRPSDLDVKVEKAVIPNVSSLNNNLCKELNKNESSDSNDKSDHIDDTGGEGEDVIDIIVNNNVNYNDTAKLDDRINDSGTKTEEIVKRNVDTGEVVNNQERVRKWNDTNGSLDLSADCCDSNLIIDESNEVKVDQYEGKSVQSSENSNLSENFPKIDDKSQIVNTYDKFSSQTNSPCSSKRSRTCSENSELQTAKKTKLATEQKLIKIFSEENISREVARNIQEVISRNIEESNFLPLLKCIGIQDNYLLYRCDTETTVVWLEKVISNFVGIPLETLVTNDATLKKVKIKMALKMNSFLSEEPRIILERIAVYNRDINVESWVVLEVKNYEDYIVLILEIDEESFQVIVKSKFSLYAGIDQAEFSLVWD